MFTTYKVETFNRSDKLGFNETCDINILMTFGS